MSRDRWDHPHPGSRAGPERGAEPEPDTELSRGGVPELDGELPRGGEPSRGGEPEPDGEPSRGGDDVTVTGRLRKLADEERIRAQLRGASAAAFRKVEDRAPPVVSSRLRRFRERIRKRPALDTVWRSMVFTLGVTLLLAGLVMFLLPGPGFATVILALVVLGSEFTWATRALDPVKGAARRASEAALDPRRRRRNLVLGTAAGIVAGAVSWWYLRSYGLTIDPIVEAAEGMWGSIRGAAG